MPSYLIPNFPQRPTVNVHSTQVVAYMHLLLCTITTITII